jgi:hypothetical protein
MSVTSTAFIPIECQIMQLDRAAITRALLGFQGRVKMDFTEEFLNCQDLDWLRHVLLAACMHCR